MATERDDATNDTEDGGSDWKALVKAVPTRQVIRFVERAPAQAIILFGVVFMAWGLSTGYKYAPSGPVAMGIAIILGAIIFAVGAIALNAKYKREGAQYRLLLTTMGILAVLFPTLIVLTHFNVIRLSGPFARFQPHGEVDEFLLALILLSLCGFLPFFVVARDLEAAPTKQKEFLEALEKSREEMVSKVEDATRSMLKGFPQVFDKALWMIKNAEQELFIVNFAANFGAPHAYNREIVDAYAAKYKRKLSDDVKTFFSTLISKVGILPNVHVLTILDKSAGDKFLVPLSEREGYSKLKPELLNQLKQTREKKRALYDAICAANRVSEGDAHERRLGVTDTLPVQLLITQVKKNDQLRGCCLVFMVGTEVIKSDLKPGEEPAFYTELEDMVKVFRNLAKALINSAVSADDEYRELDRQTNQFTYPGVH